MKEVTISAKAAESVKNEVLKVKEKAQAIVDSIAVEKEIAESKLEAAEPALLAAEEALNVRIINIEKQNCFAINYLIIWFLVFLSNHDNNFLLDLISNLE